MKKFGKPVTVMPLAVAIFVASCEERQSLDELRMSILARVPVMASKPTAKIIRSKSYVFEVVRRPVGVISEMGLVLTSMRETLERLKVS